MVLLSSGVSLSVREDDERRSETQTVDVLVEMKEMKAADRCVKHAPRLEVAEERVRGGGDADKVDVQATSSTNCLGSESV